MNIFQPECKQISVLSSYQLVPIPFQWWLVLPSISRFEQPPRVSESLWMTVRAEGMRGAVGTTYLCIREGQRKGQETSGPWEWAWGRQECHLPAFLPRAALISACLPCPALKKVPDLAVGVGMESLFSELCVKQLPLSVSTGCPSPPRGVKPGHLFKFLFT